jgi:hypothetical protein
MTNFQRITTASLIAACALALAACGKQTDNTTAPAAPAQPGAFTASDCERLPDPKALDDSAAGKATAVSQGVAAREACKKTATAQQDNDKPNADLARIREIKEREQAELAAAKQRNTESGQAAANGAAKPIRELKY